MTMGWLTDITVAVCVYGGPWYDRCDMLQCVPVICFPPHQTPLELDHLGELRKRTVWLLRCDSGMGLRWCGTNITLLVRYGSVRLSVW